MAGYWKQMQKIVEDYRLTAEPWPASTKTIAAWAIQTDRWELPAAASINKCAADLAEAMRQEYFVDTKGRRVRLLHPVQKYVSGEQLTLWNDIRTMPRSDRQMSFQQNRKRIFWDCHQLKIDVDSSNDMHPNEEPIQMIFDFTMDLAEHEGGEDDAA